MPRTIFLTGGSGFIGTEFCRTCVAAGDHVSVLCRSQESARKVKALGATAVEGNLLEPGDWQSQARVAEFVVHLAQPTLAFGNITAKRAARYERESARMDTNLLKGLDPHRVKRVIYVSGACYYGNLGEDLCDETATPRPSGLGRLAIGGMERVGVYLRQHGLPIVVAFPGTVYGAGSWFGEMILTPLMKGKRLITISGHSPFVSPINVHDCGRAIAHLLAQGATGEHYFLVDDKPVQWAALQALAAETLEAQVARFRVAAFNR